MEKNQNLKLVKRTALTLILAALALPGFAQQPTAAEHAAMLKATLAASQAVLRTGRPSHSSARARCPGKIVSVYRGMPADVPVATGRTRNAADQAASAHRRFQSCSPVTKNQRTKWA